VSPDRDPQSPTIPSLSDEDLMARVATDDGRAFTELVRRWTPEHLSRQPLEGVLTQIRGRTRDIFDKLFS